MLDEAVLITETGGPHRARLRRGTPDDRTKLMQVWGPMLTHGPPQWFDREWPWATFGDSELHLPLNNPEWVVLADELEPGARGEIFGVLVTTGPATTKEAGVHDLLQADGGLIWIEHIAIAPSLRKDCPGHQRRRPLLRIVGPPLMKAAIARSRALGLAGRLGLHAEGDVACHAYERWRMRYVGQAAHRAGGTYPVYFGDAEWAAQF